MHRRAFIASASALAAGAVAAPAVAATAPYRLPPQFQARIVDVRPGWRAGDIHVDPGQRQLYLILPGDRAIRYGVAIGSAEQYVPGTFTVNRKAEWPSWTPTPNMIRREPETYAKFAGGVPGGPDNPLGARALYLYKGGRDTMLRIHGTSQPWSIGYSVSSGCVRMLNDHAIHLYDNVPIGTRVVLH